METKKIFIVLGIIVLIAIGYFYCYVKASGSMYSVANKLDESPFYMTTQPIIVKNISLPIGTKIIYEKQYFWEKYEQKKLLDEKDIFEISFKEVIYWGGVPISKILQFYNPKMIGFSVYPDFDKLNKETQFSNLWQSCNSDLSINVKDINDWSFNKKNILDIEGCGSYQRHFSEDIKQQRFLDNFYDELIKIRD
ncbi:hypothetical protein [Formosa sp. PL04]|uniref:hypothetical protein n=1 Tax=Formosa sp. PL04 TaxID=3081755 RepID=UPI002980B315|nr:hypothetical protein [Formosa sp. PL04]MDW5290716.1 hypothetical protein [Formosa sp. PL04]